MERGGGGGKGKAGWGLLHLPCISGLLRSDYK